MDNTTLINLIKRRVFRGKKHVIRLSLVRLGGCNYRQAITVLIYYKTQPDHVFLPTKMCLLISFIKEVLSI